MAKVILLTFALVLFLIAVDWFIKNTLRGEQGVGIVFFVLVTPLFGVLGTFILSYLVSMFFTYFA
jgi:hypothetical protein